MLNQVILVGRLVEDPTLHTLKDGRKVTYVTLAVQRPYKNMETDAYDMDHINVTLWSGIAENTVQYCTKGSTIGVKARLAQRSFTCGDGETFPYFEVIAEKITFINTKRKEEV